MTNCTIPGKSVKFDKGHKFFQLLVTLTWELSLLRAMLDYVDYEVIALTQNINS